MERRDPRTGAGSLGTDDTRWDGVRVPLALEDRRALLASPFGRGLTPRQLAWLLGAETPARGGAPARLREASAGDLLARTGETQHDFLVVLAGSLTISRGRPDGARQIVGSVGVGGVAGAVTAFGPGARWPADVEADTDVRVLVVRTDALLDDGPADPARQRLLQNSLRIVAGRARHLNARGELLARRGLRERLAFHLLRHADAAGRVAVPATRQALADELGVSRSAMVRELGRMTDDGLVAPDGRGFRLVDAPELRRLAG